MARKVAKPQSFNDLVIISLCVSEPWREKGNL